MLADLDFRNNSIGFLRVLFAAVVVWSHAFEIGGYSVDPLQHLTGGALSFGYVAVGGFFTLSGFLITRSYETARSPWRFLWHRILRIFPGFWVCLIVTAFVLAPLAFFHEHATLRSFFDGPNAPWSYVISNALLQINQETIETILARTPFIPRSLNFSLWTLGYEFICYVSLAALGIVGILKRRQWVVAATFSTLFLIYAVVTYTRGMSPMNYSEAILGLLVYFSAGSCAYLFRSFIPMRTLLAVVCALVLLIAVTTSAASLVVAVCLAYLALFAAMRLNVKNFDRRMDLSYGLYIYAFPIAQLLTIFGVNALGFAWYFSLSLVIAVAFACMSWFIVERRSLALKNVGFGKRRPSQM